MKKRRKSSFRLIQALLAVSIIAVLVCAYFYIWYTYYNELMPIVYYRRGHILIIAVYTGILLFILTMYGALRISYFRTGELIYSFIVSLFIVNFITYLQICLIGTWILTPIPMLLLTIAEIPVVILWVAVSKRVVRGLYPCERLLLIYKEKTMLELAKKLDTRKDRFYIADSIELYTIKLAERNGWLGDNNTQYHDYKNASRADKASETLAYTCDINGLAYSSERDEMPVNKEAGNLTEELTAVVREQNIMSMHSNIGNMFKMNKAANKRLSEIDAVVLGADIDGEDREELLCRCYRNNMPVYLIPQTGDILQTGAKRIHLFDTPLHYIENNGLSLNQRIIKRAFDIIAAFMIMVLFMPIMLIIAAAIFIYDRGPVFYRQRRVTKDNREFSIYKFRSMSVSAEKGTGARLAEKHDKRITPVGRVIRQLHVDELPQLLNIFRGDMSLVGPRPERREIIEEYRRAIPEFDFRLKVKAGLTGYAQVYGKYNTTPEDKLKLDLYYIENYNFWLDLKLLMMTFKVLFQRERTEGVDEGQTTAQQGE